MIRYKKTGKGLLSIDGMRETMEKRMPLEADSLMCSCEGLDSQIFVLGITMTNNPCPECNSHIIGRCKSCSNWLCIGCLEKATIAYREEMGYNSVGEDAHRPS
jgi:predicted RNA-binding Zn-ribbon protein involved in translation (DUF1610 family)